MMDTILPPMQEEFQPAPLPDKRLVLIVTEGPLAGLHQIFGCIEGKDAPRLTTFLPEVRLPDGRVNGASLLRLDTRAVYYRELILPTSVKQTLAQGDKHGHFNPHQE